MPSQKCEKCIKQASENTSLLVVNDHHLLRGWRIIILEKLSSKELYSLLISATGHQPTSQKCFDQTQSPLCSFCHTEAETTLLIFHKCSGTNIL